MKRFPTPSNHYLIAIILSICYIILNILTIDQVAPWIDECMFADTPFHFLKYGTWDTFCWYAGGNQLPFSTYPPLFQILEVGWMSIFGMSLISFRSFNFVITLFLVLSIMKLLKKIGLNLSIFSTSVITLLVWGTSEMAFMYRDGRPDLLGALIVVILAIKSYEYVQKDKAVLLSIFILSVMISLAGYQTCVFGLFVFFYIYICCKKQRKPITKIIKIFVLGILTGVALTAIFMMCNGHIFAYLVSIASYSGTLKTLCAKILPTAGPLIGLNPEEWLAKLADDSPSTPIYVKIIDIFSSLSFSILLLSSTIIFLLQRNQIKSDNFILYKTICILLGLTIYIPVMMNLSGRFVSYYQWMAILPIVIVFSLLLSVISSKTFQIISSLPLIFLLFLGLKDICKYQGFDNRAFKEMIIEAGITTEDKVVAPFSAFYEVQNTGAFCYFPDIYPIDLIGMADWIIVDKNIESYHKCEIYLEEISDKQGIHVSKFANNEDLGLYIYKVTKK